MTWELIFERTTTALSVCSVVSAVVAVLLVVTMFLPSREAPGVNSDAPRRTRTSMSKVKAAVASLVLLGFATFCARAAGSIDHELATGGCEVNRGIVRELDADWRDRGVYFVVDGESYFVPRNEVPGGFGRESGFGLGSPFVDGACSRITLCHERIYRIEVGPDGACDE